MSGNSYIYTNLAGTNNITLDASGAGNIQLNTASNGLISFQKNSTQFATFDTSFNFTFLPTCTATPTTSTQLVTKAYSDLRPALSLTVPYGDTNTLLSVPNSADWYKFTFNSPSVIVTQNSASSFTGLYNTTTGVITIPTGYTGFWQVSFNSSLGTSQSFTAAAAVFGNNNALGYNDNNGVVSAVWLNGTSYSRQAFSGIGYLTAGTSYVIWYNMASSSFPVAFKSEFVQTSLRLVFLGF